ncbi:hypothetical protein RBI13_21075 [Alcaligenaceae bacterium A4P071]|nr:hypothetical protein [Alcaligenaceae bacterium A4P071]
MELSTQRRLAEAVASWLHFEFCCHRGKMLDESALKSCVGQVLSSLPAPPGSLTHTNYAHPDIAREKGPGRQRAVDYAVVTLTDKGIRPKITYAIECKWAGSSHTTDKTIIRDLTRLSLIHDRSKDTECYFVVAGEKREMGKLLAKSIFNGPAKSSGLIPKGGNGALKLRNVSNVLCQAASAIYPTCATIGMTPSGLVFTPKNNSEFTFQAFAWRIGNKAV